MSESADVIEVLRAAVQESPDNVRLRRHLADTLMRFGQTSEAVVEYQHAVRLAPEDSELKLGLARAFHAEGKYTHALVIVEELLKSPTTPAAAYVLHARLLWREGEVDRAVRQYKRAIEDDPAVAAMDLEDLLGIDADDDADVQDGRVRVGAEDDLGPRDVDLERPKITFDDVGGMDGVKDEVRMKIIHPIQHADLYKAYGKQAGGGILMYGPPGCGKTYLARAVAGEMKAGFLIVGINHILDMWLGNSERNLHEIFDNARRNAPCVLFFDEVDALGASRSELRQSAGRQVVNQFLSELDGVQYSNEGVLILAATNAPWHIDPAFRRPGRFDRIIFVPPPDEPARAAILRIHLRGKPVDDVDVERVAVKSNEFSGADLKSLVDVTVENKLRDAMKTGRPEPITTKDLLKAVKEVRPSTKEWFATARNHAVYANQGGIYDDVLKYLRLT